jgi:RNA polymerase sigma-70 factor (ECF subfamily)
MTQIHRDRSEPKTDLSSHEPHSAGPETSEPTRTRSFAGLRPNERLLMDGLLVGDPETFATLDRLFRDRVLRFAIKRLRDPAEAEDVCQDVFLDIHRSIHSFEGRSSLLTWIFGIAHHQVCRRYRRRDRDAVALEPEAMERFPTQLPDPEDRVDAARAIETLDRALEDHIAPGHRAVFHLRYGENCPTRVIAERLGRSNQSVKISLFRTRRTLESVSPTLGEIFSA